jgi:hypothetical protein
MCDRPRPSSARSRSPVVPRNTVIAADESLSLLMSPNPGLRIMRPT